MEAHVKVPSRSALNAKAQRRRKERKGKAKNAIDSALLKNFAAFAILCVLALKVVEPSTTIQALFTDRPVLLDENCG
ncbi:MAG TPA: hypothetical protein VGI40_19675 [Pirellulaceae bacterium]|jgi:hypothetical protein